MTLTRRKFAAALVVVPTSGAIAVAIATGSGPSEVSTLQGPLAQVPEGSPEQIVAKMVKTYAQAKSYEDDGEAVQVFQGAQNFTVKKTFFTRFVRPNLFRFEYSEPLGQGRQRFVIWSDAAPGGSKTWWSIRPQVADHTLGRALGAAAGVSGQTSQLVPALLMPKVMGSPSPLSTLDQLKMAGEDLVEGAICHKIEGKDLQGEANIVWIDKETSLVRKVVSTRKLPGNVVEQTTTYRPRINVEIAPDQFAFEPPKP